MTTQIVWADPPQRERTPRGAIAEFVELLKERPGEWAIFGIEQHASNASKRQERYRGTEWQTRIRTDGRRDIYARWVGEPPCT